MGDMSSKTIRNSTADFLMFALDGEGEGIQVVVEDETVWLTQRAMATLFDCTVANINMHLKAVLDSGEVDGGATIKDFLRVAPDGKNRTTKHYSLDAVISIGYRINSVRATQFRKWATGVLSTFTRQGYVLDRRRLENGQVFSADYFDRDLQKALLDKRGYDPMAGRGPGGKGTRPVSHLAGRLIRLAMRHGKVGNRPGPLPATGSYPRWSNRALQKAV